MTTEQQQQTTEVINNVPVTSPGYETSEALGVFAEKMLEMPLVDGVIILAQNRTDDRTFQIVRQISEKDINISRSDGY